MHSKEEVCPLAHYTDNNSDTNDDDDGGGSSGSGDGDDDCSSDKTKATFLTLLRADGWLD